MTRGQGLRRVSWTSSSHCNRPPSEVPAAASCATPQSNRTTLSAVVQSSCARQVVVAWLSGRLVPGLRCLFFLEAEERRHGREDADAIDPDQAEGRGKVAFDVAQGVEAGEDVRLVGVATGANGA